MKCFNYHLINENNEEDWNFFQYHFVILSNPCDSLEFNIPIEKTLILVVSPNFIFSWWIHVLQSERINDLWGVLLESDWMNSMNISQKEWCCLSVYWLQIAIPSTQANTENKLIDASVRFKPKASLQENSFTSVLSQIYHPSLLVYFKCTLSLETRGGDYIEGGSEEVSGFSYNGTRRYWTLMK